MIVVSSFAEARTVGLGRVGLVPTMGYLHEGHVSLLAAAMRECDSVVMSLFVNPLQFGESCDLSRYPRDLERDMAIAAKAGADVVFAPELDEMFTHWPPDTVVTLPTLTSVLEGSHRPGHFDGVATVVAKLFAGLRPDCAYFGRKDAQQVAVVRALARDLSMPVEVRPIPTVREQDGLALSSRNVFLGMEDRIVALSLSRGLLAAADAFDDGARASGELVAAVTAETAPGAELEYVELATQDDLRLVGQVEEPCFLSLAARVGSVRLIDNVHFDATEEGFVVDRGQWLDTTSLLYADDGDGKDG